MFDCNENLIEYSTWKDVEALTKDLYSNIRMEFQTLESACGWCREAHWNILYKKLGLVSLAKNADNGLMWAFYAQNNGFCLELDTDRFPFSHYGPFPINYTNTIPGLIHIGECGGPISMLIQTNIKNKWWEHEGEWRLYVPSPAGLDMKYFGDVETMEKYNLGDEHDRKFHYPSCALKRVVLGPKFFRWMSVCSINASEIDVRCYQEKTSLACKVLDFLSKVMEKLDLKVEWMNIIGFNTLERIPICILKYADGNAFRIIKV